nr:hypothetical protein [Tanacetum cinerariifolium]
MRIANFGNGIITIHLELDPFLDNSEETKKFEDDWDNLLDIDFEDIPEINKAGLPPFVCKMGSDEVLFTSEECKLDFDINEPIYTKLCHEFYETFEFDEAVVDDELMIKKAIKFRLCGKAYAMSILDFAKCLGLYIGAEIQETLDANILKELIDSNGRLIREEIAHSISRVVTPRTPHPTTSDMYDKISQLESRIGEIERMTRRQFYHSGIYAKVLEHIALHYRFTLRRRRMGMNGKTGVVSSLAGRN